MPPTVGDIHVDIGELECSMSPSNEVKTKQQKREEGRQRALEISMAKQRISNNLKDDAKTGNKNGKRANRKSARHGARNQHRHKHFARWILERFPHVLEDCIGDSVDERKVDATTSKPSQQMHILDVAGGKGELSARLSLCHSLHVVMIDPRRADIESVYMNSVVPKLPNKWQKSIEERSGRSPTFVQDELDKRFSQLVVPFSSPTCVGLHDDKVESRFQDEALDSAVRNASVLIGLHSDGATEAIVDAALLYQKPFVVVPCCVFPNLFRERYIRVPSDNEVYASVKGNRVIDDNGCTISAHGVGNTLQGKKVPVRTHDQFCTYLLERDPRFVREVLPFEGRNVAVWWDGK